MKLIQTLIAAWMLVVGVPTTTRAFGPLSMKDQCSSLKDMADKQRGQTNAGWRPSRAQAKDMRDRAAYFVVHCNADGTAK